MLFSPILTMATTTRRTSLGSQTTVGGSSSDRPRPTMRKNRPSSPLWCVPPSVVETMRAYLHRW